MIFYAFNRFLHFSMFLMFSNEPCVCNDFFFVLIRHLKWHWSQYYHGSFLHENTSVMHFHDAKYILPDNNFYLPSSFILDGWSIHRGSLVHFSLVIGPFIVGHWSIYHSLVHLSQGISCIHHESFVHVHQSCLLSPFLHENASIMHFRDHFCTFNN